MASKGKAPERGQARPRPSMPDVGAIRPGETAAAPDVEALLFATAKRTYDMFAFNKLAFPVGEEFEPAQRLRLAVKVADEYAEPLRRAAATSKAKAAKAAQAEAGVAPGAGAGAGAGAGTGLKALEDSGAGAGLGGAASMLMLTAGGEGGGEGGAAAAKASARAAVNEAVEAIMSKRLPGAARDEAKAARKKRKEARAAQEAAAATAAQAQAQSRALAVRRNPPSVPKPKWHAPWKLMRVISGHGGWVRSMAVEPGNEWFVTGAADRTIKVWDLASGTLKLTLTGHINAVRGLAVSPRQPYMFSCGEDKKVLCWDLEYNRVIRSYHGHLSSVYALALHPTIDVLVTGGRDSVARVWDMRTKQQIHVLGGHSNTVASIICNTTDPQVITGSMDAQVRTWDLAAGKCMTTLTHHKKGVRALAGHPREFTFMSGSADNIKKWKLPECQLLRNFSGHESIINTLAVNDEGVVVSGGDDGTLGFWDYGTGYRFQDMKAPVQPGSMDSEACIYTSTFDRTGLRLLTGEGDKTIKVWKEDETATPESHPVDMKAWADDYRKAKRY